MKLERNKKKVISKQSPTPRSITCGPENPASLGCQFYELEDKEVATYFAAQKVHEGQLGIMHGGLSASVLDELMGRSALVHVRSSEEDEPDDNTVTRCVTAEMTVKYKKPVYIGQTVYGYGSVYNKEGRRLYTSATLVDEDGEILSEAEGIFVKIKVKREDLTDNIQDRKNHQKLSKNDPKEL